MVFRKRPADPIVLCLCCVVVVRSALVLAENVFKLRALNDASKQFA